MTQVSIGPGLSPEEESDLRRAQRIAELAEADRSADVIEQKIVGMRQTLDDRRAEIARLRAELKG